MEEIWEKKFIQLKKECEDRQSVLIPGKDKYDWAYESGYMAALTQLEEAVMVWRRN